MKKRILLYGPVLGHFKNAYGGGVGGYTRKMKLYLNHFSSERYYHDAAFHTIKGQLPGDILPLRLILDAVSFLRGCFPKRPALVHILGQYRRAIIREFFIAFMCRLLRIPYVYEIKAGVFINWYTKTTPTYRWLMEYCLKNAGVILCQGEKYVRFLAEELSLESTYFPNFVPENEIPDQTNPILEKPGEIRLLFVGFAYEGKGVFELVEAVNQFSADCHVKVRLHFVGKEHPDFTTFLEQYAPHPCLEIIRSGKLDRAGVQRAFALADVYAYPTSHYAEGHSNTINEAMMHGKVLLSTRQGFLGDILNPDIAYLIDEPSVVAISQALEEIHDNRAIARQKAMAARAKSLAEFTATKAFQRLEKAYNLI